MIPFKTLKIPFQPFYPKKQYNQSKKYFLTLSITSLILASVRKPRLTDSFQFISDDSYSGSIVHQSLLYKMYLFTSSSLYHKTEIFSIFSIIISKNRVKFPLLLALFGNVFCVWFWYIRSISFTLTFTWTNKNHQNTN